MQGYAQTMDYLQKFIHTSWRLQLDGADTNMPATALLTGINQPDHFHLFKTFADGICKMNNARVCIIQSRDCPNMKSAIETMVSGLMEGSNNLANLPEKEGSDEGDEVIHYN